MTAQQNSHLCWMVLMMRLKAKKQVASGDHDSEFKEHKDSMNN